jgi:uncharacterized membrane protein YqgA involved in biofilm formation
LTDAVISQYLIYGVPAVVLVACLVGAIINSGFNPKYKSLLALSLGALAGLGIAYQTGTNYVGGFIIGLAIGASAGQTQQGIATLIRNRAAMKAARKKTTI